MDSGKKRKSDHLVLPYHALLKDVFFEICLYNVDAVSNFLDNGGDVNVVDKHKQTPLFVACAVGCVEITNFLLTRGANVNKPETHGFTPLHVACKHGAVQIVDMLITNGANVNKKDNRNRTPMSVTLHSTACDDSIKLEVLKLLCENQASF